MDYLSALIYGIIQGFSEFLPISSSGHLALLPHVMKIEDPGVLFDLCMHFGTALAVILYFRKQLKDIFLSIPKILKNPKSDDSYFSKNLILATVTSVILIVILIKPSQWARSPYIIIANQVVFGLILYFADRYQRKVKHEAPFHHRLAMKESILIGLAQALAIFPGVSRSGITLSTAFFLKVNRHEAGAFSFLLSLPIIIAGILKELPHLRDALETDFSMGPLLLGIFSSFIVGFVTIHYFLKIIAKINLGIFTIYRIALSLLMLWFLNS